MNRLLPRNVAVMAACALTFRASLALAQMPTAIVTVDVNKPGTPMPPMFYGLMTEEINHAYDGGLYAELIQNRTFQDNDQNPVHWTAVGNATLTLDRSEPVNWANPVCLRVGLSGELAGVANGGFWGIPVKPKTAYAVSFFAKGSDGFAGPVTAAIVGNDGTEFASATSESVTAGWKKFTLTLTTADGITPTKAAKFVLRASGNGSVSFNLVSLFPPTYQDVPGGLRPDLMELMAGLKPSFIRLPGGNYLEGNSFPDRFNWKRQIGPVEERPGHMGCWGYRSSDGMGLTQMLLWCKQLNAEPVLGVFAGYTLNRDHLNAGPDMQPFVDEALEEIEYITGGPDTKWGKQRIADGFPEPFKLTYVEIGNEDWFDRSPSYDGRFTQMFDAIRAKYPHLKIIATAPVHSRKPDLYDDHFYQPPNAMAADSNHYDKPKDQKAKPELRYDGGRFHGNFVRGQVPDVFCGEWATQEGAPTPTHRAALADAIWLIGLERNADLVKMQCYAPLFANVNTNPRGWQWGTNLIGYDAMTAFGSPSYYAQAMIAQNKADHLLPARMQVQKNTVAKSNVPHGAVGLGAWLTDVEYKDLRVTGADGKSLLSADAAMNIADWKFTGDAWSSQDGTLRPTKPGESSWGVVGDPKWTNYTVSVKAKKNAGEEGFLVLWHAENSDNYNWWNIGGWGNTRTQAEVAHEGNRVPYGPASDFRAETGRWYDLRIEVRGGHAKCFIDNKLVTEANDIPAPPPPQPMYVGAGYVNGTREVVIKVVNYSGEAIDTTLNLNGVKTVAATGKAIVLSGQPRDVNSLAEPTKVSPKEEVIQDASPKIRRTFPAYSFTLLRVGATTE